MSEAKVRLETRDDGVRIVRLINPAMRNAIDAQTRDELSAAVAEVAADRAAHALIITGDGPAFCAGANLVEQFGHAMETEVDDLRAELWQTYESFLAVVRLPIPTIAAVRGPAIGAGLNLALVCDIRIAAPDAAFGAVFTKIGLHPGGGCSFFLARAVGPQRALRILLDGETIDATTALRDRLVEEIADDPEAAALEIAARWGKLDPLLSRGIKRSIQLAMDAGFAASSEYESWCQALSTKSPEAQRVVDRFRRKEGAR